MPTLPSPNTGSTLLSRPCRRPGDGYRVYPRLETSESVKLSEFLELGFPPKENWRHVASDHKTSETQNAALRSLALASLPPLSNAFDYALSNAESAQVFWGMLQKPEASGCT